MFPCCSTCEELSIDVSISYIVSLSYCCVCSPLPVNCPALPWQSFAPSRQSDGRHFCAATQPVRAAVLWLCAQTTPLPLLFLAKQTQCAGFSKQKKPNVLAFPSKRHPICWLFQAKETQYAVFSKQKTPNMLAFPSKTNPMCWLFQAKETQCAGFS